ncbi:MAG: hypothetical protein IKR85_12090 [Clostridia bacterium]|nr:hypothetical protein [Clostridia bacterium]
MNEIIRQIEEAVSEVRIKSVPQETDIHAFIAEALEAHNISFIHEARISPHKRADFLVGSVIIEIKKGRPSPAALSKQLYAYLAEASITGAVVITQRSIKLAAAINSKPVKQIALDRLWGIYLP